MAPPQPGARGGSPRPPSYAPAKYNIMLFKLLSGSWPKLYLVI